MQKPLLASILYLLATFKYWNLSALSANVDLRMEGITEKITLAHKHDICPNND